MKITQLKSGDKFSFVKEEEVIEIAWSRVQTFKVSNPPYPRTFCVVKPTKWLNSHSAYRYALPIDLEVTVWP